MNQRKNNIFICETTYIYLYNNLIYVYVNSNDIFNGKYQFSSESIDPHFPSCWIYVYAEIVIYCYTTERNANATAHSHWEIPRFTVWMVRALFVRNRERDEFQSEFILVHHIRGIRWSACHQNPHINVN